MTTQGMMMFSFVRLLNPDAGAAAAVDEEAAADEEVGVEDADEPVSCAFAELTAEAAEPAAPMKALRGFAVLLAACPNTPEECARARTTVRRVWWYIVKSPWALMMGWYKIWLFDILRRMKENRWF